MKIETRVSPILTKKHVDGIILRRWKDIKMKTIARYCDHIAVKLNLHLDTMKFLLYELHKILKRKPEALMIRNGCKLKQHSPY